MPPQGSDFWDDTPKSAPTGGGSFWDAADTHSDALARVAQPTQFEKDRTPQEGVAGGAWNELKNQASGVVKSLYPNRENWYGTAGMGGPLAPLKGALDAIPSWQRRTEEGRSPIYKAATGLTEAVGIPTGAQGEEEAAKHGDIGGVVGHAAIPMLEAAGGYGASQLAPHIPAMRGKLAEIATTPEGELKPLVHGASRVAGGAAGATVGGAMGHPEIGAYAGYRAGPDIVKSILGERPAPPAFKPMGPATPPADVLQSARAVSTSPFELKPPPQETTPAIQQQMEFPAVNEIAFRTDANGTRWAKLPNSPAEVSIPKNLSGNDAQKYAQEKLELQSNFAKSRSPMGQLDELMKQQGGAPEGGIPALQPNVPLREQRQLQKPFGNRAAVEVSEMHGPRTTAPEQIPQAIPNAVDQAMGGDLTPEAIEKARLQEKYPDAGDRQAIHRTSEKTFEATRDNPELRKALGDLKAHDNQGGPDLARAAANLGEDLGERRIGNKKAEWMGAGQIGRGEMFDRLLDKGYTPQQILDAAQAEPASIPTLAKPGPMRTSGRKQVREKTGD